MLRTPLRLALAASAVTMLSFPAAALADHRDAPPAQVRIADASATEAPPFLVMGHRGASGYRPEHTLASYTLAARMGADYIEPDLVSTKDGVLVARHENEISGTTDVEAHPEFADRRATKVIDGVSITGWFTEDFTLAELKTLRAEERLPDVRQENTIFNGRYEIPTLQEVIDLAKRLSAKLGRDIGIIPETKHPTYFDAIGLSLEEPLVRTLRANHLAGRDDHVIVQSFETGNLEELEHKLPKTPLVQLLSATGAPYDLVAAGDPRTYADLSSPSGLRKIARYADVIGPEKAQIVPRDAAGNSFAPTTLVDDAHDAGLAVVPYTFRAENQFLPAELRSSEDPNAFGDLFAEIEQFVGLGVDGLFTDQTDIAVAVREDA